MVKPDISENCRISSTRNYPYEKMDKTSLAKGTIVYPFDEKYTKNPKLRLQGETMLNSTL